MGPANRNFWLVAALVLMAGSLSAQGARVWLNPNARVLEKLPLQVDVAGTTPGMKVTLSIQQDCASLGAPQLGPSCPALWGPLEVTAGKPPFSHQFPATELAKLPEGVFLWVVVESANWKEIARFYRGEPCSVYGALIGTITGGKCSLSLIQILRDAVRSVDRPATYEIKVQKMGSAEEPKSIAETRGATGVAWAGQDLLVTRSEGSASSLFVIPSEGKRKVLWSSSDAKRVVAAPFALQNGGFVVVMQPPGPLALGDPPEVAELRLLSSDGGQQKSFLLPVKSHQWLKQKDRLLFGLTLGLGDSRPQIFQVNLDSGKYEELGFAGELYLALQRRPNSKSESALAAWFNRTSGRWQISVVSPGSTEDLIKGSTDNLAPAWSPDGSKLAFLSGVPEP